MTPIALVLNLLLGSLLVAAIALGLRLDRRLRALRDSQQGFIKAVADLDHAAARTREGLQQWRDATDEARELLHDRIEKAKAQAGRLEALLNRPPPEAPAAPAAPPPSRIAELTRMFDLPRREPEVQDAEQRAEALAAAVLQMGRSAPEPAAQSSRPPPRPPAPARAVVDDDLFDAIPIGAAALQRDLASALGGRR